MRIMHLAPCAACILHPSTGHVHHASAPCFCICIMHGRRPHSRCRRTDTSEHTQIQMKACMRMQTWIQHTATHRNMFLCLCFSYRIHMVHHALRVQNHRLSKTLDIHGLHGRRPHGCPCLSVCLYVCLCLIDYAMRVMHLECYNIHGGRFRLLLRTPHARQLPP